MAGQVALRQLLDSALGNPNKSTVDFGLLKDFLVQFLVATNQADFIAQEEVRPNGLPETETEDAVQQPIGNEETAKERKTVSFSEKEELEESGKNENAEQKRIETLEKQHTRLRKSHDEILQRLNKIEQNAPLFQPFERLPSGAELLLTRKSLVSQKPLVGNTEESPAVSDDRKDGMANEGGEGREKYLSNSWNTVRVNKRLQALEDGVDKLFAMLDILTAGQNELRNRNGGTADSEDVNKLREEISQLQNVGSDTGDATQLKDAVDKELSSLKERLDGIESQLSRLNEFEKTLGTVSESNSSLEKRLNDLETKHNSSSMNEHEAHEGNEVDGDALKDALNEIESLKKNNRQEDLENMIKKFAEDLEKMNEILCGVVKRQEIEDMVHWPQLEDAFNVRGFIESQEKLQELKQSESEEKVDVKEEDGDTTEKKDAEIGEKHDKEDSTFDLAAVEESNEDKVKHAASRSNTQIERANTQSHPSPEMKECLQRIGDLASTFGTFEERFNAVVASSDSTEQTVEQLKKDVRDLNDVTSSLNEISGHNKALIEQMRTDIGQLIDEYNYGKADGNSEELQGIKEHLMDLENRANGTSLALNDLSAGVYNELRAKQKLIDALYECVDGLQRNKVDIGNAQSIFDLDAYKSALDSKVSMNDFDEMMVALNANLQNVIRKLDKYESEEESLKDALERLSSNMKDKLDAKAEESLKKYLESRIAQLQKSRESLVSRAGHDIITNAAGFRRPLSTLFHCISCDRPVHLDRYGGITSKACVKKENGNRDLAKTDSGTRLPLHALQSDRKLRREMWRDPLAVDRYCGGNYTAFVNSPRKNQLKSNTIHKEFETPPNAKELLEQRKRERTIVNYLLGTDGQVYRGRYKMTDLRNSQFHTENEGRFRSRSAESGTRTMAEQRHVTGTMSNPASVATSPRNLPPIGQDVLGVRTSQITDRYDVTQEKPNSATWGSKS